MSGVDSAVIDTGLTFLWVWDIDLVVKVGSNMARDYADDIRAKQLVMKVMGSRTFVIIASQKEHQ